MKWPQSSLALPRDAHTTLPAGVSMDSLVQRRMYWFGVWFMAALLPIYTTVTAMRGNPALPWMMFTIVFGGLALNIVWTRRHGDYTRGVAWLHGVTFFGLLAGALFNISVNSPAFWWLTVIPFAAILSGNTRLGVCMGGIVVAYTIAAYLRASGANVDPTLLNLRLHLAVGLSTVYACAYLALATMWRLQLQRSLERARHEATAAADAKARFLANMSHEIRTPLGGVIGAAELLRARHVSDAQRAQLASLQEQSAKALLALINDVLDWSKLDAGKLTLASEPVYLRGLVFESNELFAVTAFDKGIELTSSCNPDVPRRFMGDGTRIRQIVNNLVSNAVKFTHQGGVHVHLALEGDTPRAEGGGPAIGDRRHVRIEVADSGIGIAPEQLGALFNPFIQADLSVTRKYGGTGLGLSISNELARMMGGRIEVSSTAGQGSTFTLVLPLQVEGPPAPTQPLQRHPDVTLASLSPGLIRHVRSLLHELQIEPEVQRGLPTDEQLARSRLLLLDAPLLHRLPDPRAWLEAQAARGLRVVVMAPLNADAMPGTLPSAVMLYKPVRRAALDALLRALTEGRSAAALPPAPASSGAHVLLCEDNPVNQIIVQAMLAETGATCVVAGNGREALACLASEPFDLVLMDLQMPELDGLAATRLWREQERQQGRAPVPVIAMTANAEGEEGQACRAAGMSGFLAKPFGLGALRKCVAEFTRPQLPA